MSFFFSFILLGIVACRYFGKSMMKKIPFNDVLGIMHSGISHINLYKNKYVPMSEQNEPEEKKGLL
jgi:hypothetical protein